MKKLILSAAFIITTAISINAFGVVCTKYPYSMPSGYTEAGTIDTTDSKCALTFENGYWCNEQQRRCNKIIGCSVCDDYANRRENIYLSNSVCPNQSVEVSICCEQYPGTTEASSWTRVSFNVLYQYQQIKTYECDGSYTISYAYRCAGGAYGTASGGNTSITNLSGCSRCPSGGTSSAGSTSITSCYIPSGTTFSEASGTGTYTQNCYYKN